MKDQRAGGTRKRLLRREDGASAVEFALIAPLLFMIVFGILYFGVAFMKMQNLR
ncbi:MAG TPA: TadE/TadG family type IV pilus assembly protein, partial [Actinomycetota bacterium]|nr:TadE/TadG family type IV pilus assembly protein [Actinomycetota bacterium]